MTESATAVLAGGCFWCLEAVFSDLRGVSAVLSGYCGGARPQPSYEQVCAGVTGHAEVVKIVFDPAQISFRDLLEVFFVIHDPTTVDRQGNDVGSQYRSAIFAQSAEQAEQARALIAEMTAAQLFASPLVTAVHEPGSVFWPAEDYHRDYYTQHPRQPYCQTVVAPKLAKLHAKFRALCKSKPSATP